jgi:hypothetical protein
MLHNPELKSMEHSDLNLLLSDSNSGIPKILYTDLLYQNRTQVPIWILGSTMLLPCLYHMYKYKSMVKGLQLRAYLEGGN